MKLQNLIENVYYHVTSKNNLPNILKKGLIPSIGSRSRIFGESEHAIYLFGSEDDAENAVMNWLGDEFEDDENLVLLTIKLDDVSKHQEFEFVYNKIISPEK